MMKKPFYNNLLGDGKIIGDYYKNDPFHSEKRQFVLDEVGKGKVVLDVGCNEGFIGGKLIKNKNVVYGIDIVNRNLIKAKSKGMIVSNVDIDRDKLPYRDNFFDVVVLADFIEHVFDTDAVLRKCAKVLKKNGKLIITTPNIASLGRRMMLLLGMSPFTEHSLELSTSGLPAAGHIRYYTVPTLKEQLEYDGFENVKIRGNAVNFITFRSRFLGKIFPSLSVTLTAIAHKKNKN